MKKNFNTSGLGKNKSLFSTVFPEGFCRGTAVAEQQTPDRNTRGQKSGGFTLIELLVVVLIIGILAAVALPQYQKTVNKARFAQLVTATRSLRDAEQRYYMENNAYTTNAEELDVSFPLQNDSVKTTVKLTNGYCVLYSDYVYCMHNGLASYFLYYGSETKECCSYPNTSFAADPLCREVTQADSWFNGCGESECHCWVH